MSAEVLRRAASLMRERAEAAQRFIDLGQEWWGRDGLTDAFVALSGDEDTVIWGASEDAEHIASWHPAVALAVADWLDGVALFVEAKDDEEYFDLDGDPIAAEDTHAIGSALDVARAYLGERP